jgi:hypothetical protein
MREQSNELDAANLQEIDVNTSVGSKIKSKAQSHQAAVHSPSSSSSLCPP